jgi:hypothetical protein
VNSNEAQRLQRYLAMLLAEFDAGLGDGGPPEVLETVVGVALERVGGVSSASITTKTARALTTATSSDHPARTADHLQHELGYGPALEAIATQTSCHLPDATRDRRWPELGANLISQGVFSALAVPLGQARPDTRKTVAAALTLYATTVDAFSPTSVLLATMLAAHAGPRWSAAVCEARTADLEQAMTTRANIGPAIGVLMIRHDLGHDEAARLLRAISNRANRKVADLAREIVELRDVPSTAKRYLHTTPCT